MRCLGKSLKIMLKADIMPILPPLGYDGRGTTLRLNSDSVAVEVAIALKAAKDGARVVIAAKTAEPHPKLPGTIYTAAKESKTSL